MLHPHRSLQDLVDGELTDRRRIAVERHVSRCASCAASVAHLRGLKSALLGLRNPSPDPDFQQRLLSPALTSASSEAHEIRTGSSAAFIRAHHESTAPRRRQRTLLLAGGSAVVATTVLASAYVVGSETGPVTAEGARGSTALRAGWDSVAPQTPTYLDTGQLETLRAGGWYCPELESLGFTLQGAEGITVAGRPTLELVLENDGDTVTVYEQRKVGDAGGAGEPPLNAVTGSPVTSDGFEHVGGADRDIWVRSGEPWQVVLDSPTVTYTVVSDLPAAAMPQTLNQLVATEHAQLSLSPEGQDDSMMERIIRGLARITHPEGDGR
ncbi:zf-HC2 domain-containing protein [Arthrobacter sp. B0490]|uniref:zf-HC2 domain-containing protein n=1 Tax=Arthrobacter sp. B0490 TaxID=2058891 RepID=UPI000CE55D64|nr:zf-HC2 domain-containing protein [Arthrobacter sp. B0490]